MKGSTVMNKRNMTIPVRGKKGQWTKGGNFQFYCSCYTIEIEMKNQTCNHRNIAIVVKHMMINLEK